MFSSLSGTFQPSGLMTKIVVSSVTDRLYRPSESVFTTSEPLDTNTSAIPAFPGSRWLLAFLSLKTIPLAVTPRAIEKVSAAMSIKYMWLRDMLLSLIAKGRVASPGLLRVSYVFPANSISGGNGDSNARLIFRNQVNQFRYTSHELLRKPLLGTRFLSNFIQFFWAFEIHFTGLPILNGLILIIFIKARRCAARHTISSYHEE